MEYGLLLSRLQIAVPFAFHIVFPAIALGLASYLAVLEGLWLTTRNTAFRNLRLFWIRIFAVAFGMGLVSVIWILAGGGVGQALTGWRPDLLSPALAYGLGHMILAAYLATALVVGAASAWRLLREPDEEESCLAMKMAVGMFAIAAPLQLVLGDLSGARSAGPAPIEAGAAGAVVVGVDLALMALGAWGAYLIWRGRLGGAAPFLWTCVVLAPAGIVGALAGWLVAEIDRSPASLVGAAQGVPSGPFLTFVAVYVVVFALAAFHILTLIGRGPRPLPLEGAV